MATGEPGGEWFCSASRPSTSSSASCTPWPTPSWATRPTSSSGYTSRSSSSSSGLGYVLWLLVEGVTNRAATLARALIIPFLVAYTALDAILGIAWGIAAETANDLPAADQQGAGRLIDELISGDPDPRGLILYWGAGLLWLAVALAVVAALTGHSPARRPRVDGTRRGSVHARTRPTDGSGRDGLVPPRHRVDRVPPSTGRAVDPGGRRMTEQGARLSRFQLPTSESVAKFGPPTCASSSSTPPSLERRVGTAMECRAPGDDLVDLQDLARRLAGARSGHDEPGTHVDRDEAPANSPSKMPNQWVVYS